MYSKLCKNCIIYREKLLFKLLALLRKIAKILKLFIINNFLILIN